MSRFLSSELKYLTLFYFYLGEFLSKLRFLLLNRDFTPDLLLRGVLKYFAPLVTGTQRDWKLLTDER